MEWENVGTLAVSSYDSELLTLSIPVSSPLLKVRGLNLDPAQVGYAKLGRLRLFTLDGSEAFSTVIFQRSAVIEVPNWLNLYTVGFQPERWINNAQVQIEKVSRVKYYIWEADEVATIKQVLENSAQIGSIAADVDVLKADVIRIEGNGAKQVDVFFGDILSQTETYPYSHVIIDHLLSDPNPSVQFFNADGQPELLDWKPIDGNSIVVNVFGASSLPNSSWKAVVTGTPIAQSGNQD